MSSPWALELHKLLANEDLAINVKASKAMGVLQNAGMVWTSKLKPKDVLVHPKNRSGQMCNHHDVVEKGMAISEVGWEMAKIRSPVGVEIPSQGKLRDDILEANSKLHAESQGVLARPTGQEKIASISASHTTAFLKSLEQGCKLPGDVVLDKLLHQGDDLQTLLADGWMWSVISSKVEVEVPALLSVLQQAFNSDWLASILCLLGSVVFGCNVCDVCISCNIPVGDLAIAKVPNELEVAFSIATYYRLQAPDKKDLSKAIAQAAASAPPCKPYINCVGAFVANYCGGETFGLLKYLDHIGCLVALKIHESFQFCCFCRADFATDIADIAVAYESFLFQPFVGCQWASHRYCVGKAGLLLPFVGSPVGNTPALFVKLVLLLPFAGFHVVHIN